ncbi:MAG: hypothetical protein KAJ29_08100, partial [Alphaproteobacteria bacterium]|nr:hypothetical protein [Alphaproteobacteria bacterium]
LKKAADDKQKTSRKAVQDDTIGSASSDPDAVLSLDDSTVAVTDAQQGEAVSASKADEKKSEIVDEQAEELTLDSIDDENVTEAVTVEKTEPAEDAANEEEELSLKQDDNFDRENVASYTVSDEALSMLIYKTNHDVKRGNRLLLTGILLISLVILVSGGVYYYTDMQAEIANLERKHQIAMQMMRSKTSKEKVPVESKIIRNLAGDSDLADKVQFAKKQMMEERNSQQVKRRPAATVNTKTSTVSSTMSFQKTNKIDPVAEKLESAWLAYEAAQYGRAKNLYKEILDIEDDNRDALLGLGAIAIVEKDNAMASGIYRSLLKHDPRDPIAIAALANLQSTDTSAQADERYLLDMLKKTPDDAHLNF